MSLGRRLPSALSVQQRRRCHSISTVSCYFTIHRGRKVFDIPVSIMIGRAPCKQGCWMEQHPHHYAACSSNSQPTCTSGMPSIPTDTMHRPSTDGLPAYCMLSSIGRFVLACPQIRNSRALVGPTFRDADLSLLRLPVYLSERAPDGELSNLQNFALRTAPFW